MLNNSNNKLAAIHNKVEELIKFLDRALEALV